MSDDDKNRMLESGRDRASKYHLNFSLNNFVKPIINSIKKFAKDTLNGKNTTGLIFFIPKNKYYFSSHGFVTGIRMDDLMCLWDSSFLVSKKKYPQLH